MGLFDKQEFLRILKADRDGLATEKEREFLHAYYNAFNIRPDFTDQCNLADQASLKYRMKERIDAEISLKRPIIWKKWVAIAAVAILVTGLSTYSFLTMDTLRNRSVLIKSDNAWTGNKAILTLADGRTVTLNNEKEGVVINAGNIKYNDGTEINLASGQLVPSDSEISGASLKGESTSELYAISTPRGSQYQVTLPDHTKVWLNASSSLKYPSRFGENERRVELKGEAYFEVAKNTKQPFVVMCDNQEVQVLGTKFNIAAYSSNYVIQTTLLEGKVAVSLKDQRIYLLPGEQVMYDRNAGTVAKLNVNAERFIQWKEKYIVFDGLKLDEILHSITRWYNVDFDIQDKSLSRIIFQGGVHRYDDLEKVLEVLERTGDVKFHRKGKERIEVTK